MLQLNIFKATGVLNMLSTHSLNFVYCRISNNVFCVHILHILHSSVLEMVSLKHCHISDMTRTLLAAAHAPLTLWVEAALTFIHLSNVLPTPTLQWSTPYTLLFGLSPTYSHLHTFGCMCFPYLGHYIQNKLMSRSVECAFLGYSPSHKG